MSENPIVEVIAAVVEALGHAGVDYAITGSVASGLHGEPITTQDVDLIVRMTAEQARQVAGALPRRFYCNEESLVEAAQSCGFVNVIDMDTTLKVDLSVVSPTPFHTNVFQRRQHMEFESGGPGFDVVSAEDIILMKLVWRKESCSTKQWENALGVARVKGARMDWKYLFEQAKSLGIEEDLIRLRDEAGI